jgi:hypothetical protein
MLVARLTRTAIVLLVCVSFAAAAGEPPADAGALQPGTEAKSAATNNGEFKPPPGFRTRKLGSHILYCRKEVVLGTRFQSEKCYDQAGIRQLLRKQLEDTEMMERVRQCAVGNCPTG